MFNPAYPSALLEQSRLHLVFRAAIRATCALAVATLLTYVCLRTGVIPQRFSSVVKEAVFEFPHPYLTTILLIFLPLLPGAGILITDFGHSVGMHFRRYTQKKGIVYAVIQGCALLVFVLAPALAVGSIWVQLLLATAAIAATGSGDLPISRSPRWWNLVTGIAVGAATGSWVFGLVAFHVVQLAAAQARRGRWVWLMAGLCAFGLCYSTVGLRPWGAVAFALMVTILYSHCIFPDSALGHRRRNTIVLSVIVLSVGAILGWSGGSLSLPSIFAHSQMTADSHLVVATAFALFLSAVSLAATVGRHGERGSVQLVILVGLLFFALPSFLGLLVVQQYKIGGFLLVLLARAIALNRSMFRSVLGGTCAMLAMTSTIFFRGLTGGVLKVRGAMWRVPVEGAWIEFFLGILCGAVAWVSRSREGGRAPSRSRARGRGSIYLSAVALPLLAIGAALTRYSDDLEYGPYGPILHSPNGQAASSFISLVVGLCFLQFSTRHFLNQGPFDRSAWVVVVVLLSLMPSIGIIFPLALLAVGGPAAIMSRHLVRPSGRDWFLVALLCVVDWLVVAAHSGLWLASLVLLASLPAVVVIALVRSTPLGLPLSVRLENGGKIIALLKMCMWGSNLTFCLALSTSLAMHYLLRNDFLANLFVTVGIFSLVTAGITSLIVWWCGWLLRRLRAGVVRPRQFSD